MAKGFGGKWPAVHMQRTRVKESVEGPSCQKLRLLNALLTGESLAVCSLSLVNDIVDRTILLERRVDAA